MFSKTLVLTMLVLLSLSLGAGAVVFDPPESYNESPALAERVAEGELPPVEERLPDQPLVVGPGTMVSEEFMDWEPGRYGGTLRTVHLVPDHSPDVIQGNFDALLGRPFYEGGRFDDLYGSFLLDFEVNEDNTEYTFYLREGVRWSDGVPVTTEDVRFTFEDVIFNPEITPAISHVLRSGGRPDGEPLELTIVDDYTFVITFDEPYGAFLTEITEHWRLGLQGFVRPKHYLKQFHADYTPLEELRPYLEEQELEEEHWMQLFTMKDIANGWETTKSTAIGTPVLNPWMRVESPGELIVMERNPYYWKVDVEGNQLPYIDRLVSEEVSDMQTQILKTVSGEVDFLREDAGANDLAVFVEFEEEGGYTTGLYGGFHATSNIYLNFTYDDPTWRLVTEDVRFRRALAYAIDNEEIIDSVFFGMAELPQWTPADYDPAEAERLLDDMGMDERDDDGYRLGPDGEEFEVFFEVDTGFAEWIPTAELVIEHLQDVGLNASMRQVAPALRGQKAGANELMATIGQTQSSWWMHIADTYLPSYHGYGRLWNLWYHSGGETGEEPPEWMQPMYDFHHRARAIRPDSEEMPELTEEFRQWYYETIPVYHIVEEQAEVMITSNRLRNIVDEGDAWPTATYFTLEQVFFVDEE